MLHTLAVLVFNEAGVQGESQHGLSGVADARTVDVLVVAGSSFEDSSVELKAVGTAGKHMELPVRGADSARTNDLN